MTTQTRTRIADLPVALRQAAESLKKLSRSELETLGLLLDDKSLKILKRSVFQARGGRVRELGGVKDTDTAIGIYLKEKEQQKLKVLRTPTDLN